jgi:hypothetical protein
MLPFPPVPTRRRTIILRYHVHCTLYTVPVYSVLNLVTHISYFASTVSRISHLLSRSDTSCPLSLILYQVPVRFGKMLSRSSSILLNLAKTLLKIVLCFSLDGILTNHYSKVLTEYRVPYVNGRHSSLFLRSNEHSLDPSSNDQIKRVNVGRKRILKNIPVNG